MSGYPVDTSEDVIDFELETDDGTGDPSAQAEPEKEPEKEPAKSEDTSPENPEKDQEDDFVEYDEETLKPKKEEGEEGAAEPAKGETTTEETAELPDFLKTEDPMVSALAAVYEKDKDMAEKIHDVINIQKELIGHGVTTDHLREYAQSHQAINEERSKFQHVISALGGVDAYAKVGNFDKALTKLGFDVDVIEQFFVERAAYKEQGKLEDFNRIVGQNDETVKLMMENQKLHQMNQQVQQQSIQRTISEFEIKLRQNPLGAQFDKIIGKPGRAQQEFSTVYATLPESDRTPEGLNKAYKMWEDRMQEYVTAFGGKVKNTTDKSEVERPGSLNPPSGKAAGKSPASSRKVETVRTEEDFWNKNYEQ